MWHNSPSFPKHSEFTAVCREMSAQEGQGWHCPCWGPFDTGQESLCSIPANISLDGLSHMASSPLCSRLENRGQANKAGEEKPQALSKVALNHCHQLQSDRAGKWKGLIHLDWHGLGSHRWVSIRISEPAPCPCPGTAPWPGGQDRPGRAVGLGTSQQGKRGPAQDTWQQIIAWVYPWTVGHSVR